MSGAFHPECLLASWRNNLYPEFGPCHSLEFRVGLKTISSLQRKEVRRLRGRTKIEQLKPS
ncbi:uncharacterized protein RSE6_12890 [Rhynchosporium secalis]|uniref:Uncharacterized protein n=1 Tax=Rhynchosporium secalis TaxID=38038 RepID=A0A1E1MSC1_RHYSE|nr:uncharacterized protein RSE6_12890 [Rhynchosporium secalis]